MSDPTIDQIDHVLDLMHNGFSREGACVAVVESVTGIQYAWTHPLFDALINQVDIRDAVDITEQIS